MTRESFETMLTGGHPNSLGRTEEVVEIVLQDRDRIEELYQCYNSSDEVVRLRTSSAFKRMTRHRPDWFEPYINKFLNEVSKIEQPSAQWTLAQLCLMVQDRLSHAQLVRAKEVLQANLIGYTDWIVLNMTMETLTAWAKKDAELKAWLLPHLKTLTTDSRKSVAKRANKFLKALSK